MSLRLATLLSSVLLAMTTPVHAGSRGTWPIVETRAQAQCPWPSQAAAVRIIANAAQWQSLFPPAEQAPFAEMPDWTKQAVVALTAGLRPTSGYVLEATAKAFERRRDALHLSYRERQPAAESFQQQVETRPCLFILTTRGPWRKVVVRNAENGAELEARLPPSDVKHP